MLGQGIFVKLFGFRSLSSSILGNIFTQKLRLLFVQSTQVSESLNSVAVLRIKASLGYFRLRDSFGFQRAEPHESFPADLTAVREYLNLGPEMAREKQGLHLWRPGAPPKSGCGRDSSGP